ncbi:MAG: heavy metal-binding domain-containing protein [Sandaracinaceae bacterium]|nr:heavy metal-binding domain-containing protein [Sandaracinaceae bacterium]
MHISAMSGNEIYCLAQKGLTPGEIVVGNSVVSLGVAGGLGAAGRTFAGGEITQITSLISDGRHAAIQRMEDEARRDGAIGVTGVRSKLGRLAGFTEFLAQGTGVVAQQPSGNFFSTAASGIGLYCQLDAGYQPVRFAMGNIAYALGVGRGVMGSFRTLARGEVSEYSSMYNEIRHTALARLRQEAAAAGANSVVDVRIEMLPYGPGTVELLLTGTASHHPAISQGPVQPQQVITSELTGEELWNLASLGYAPLQIVMATSVYSLGVAAGIGAMFQGLRRTELPEVTQLIYQARENCLELVRREAQSLGAERVLSTRLQIREIGQGLVEIVAFGTAVRRALPGMDTQSKQLIPQALILDRGSLDAEENIQGLSPAAAPMDVARRGLQGGGQQLIGCAIMIVVFGFMICMGLFTALVQGH